MMINLIMAELYKESRKTSFKVFVMLIIFVSIFSLIIINKNVTIESEQMVSYPLYTLEEYKSVNKYGDYQQYLNDYDKYEKIIDREIQLKNNGDNKVKVLFSYYPTFLFVVGIIVIYISFHIFSYDFQTRSIRYLFLSSNGRNKILFSKIISAILLAIFFSMILFLTYLFMLFLFTKDSLLVYTMYVYIGDSVKIVPIVLYYLVKTFIYLIPVSFIAITTIFLTISFKGSTLALIISNVIYFCSLLFSQLLISYGYTFVEYSFMPYIDFTYFESPTTVALNNLIYNIDLSFMNGICLMGIYAFVFVILSIFLIKRDV